MEKRRKFGQNRSSIISIYFILQLRIGGFSIYSIGIQVTAGSWLERMLYLKWRNKLEYTILP